MNSRWSKTPSGRFGRRSPEAQACDVAAATSAPRGSGGLAQLRLEGDPHHAAGLIVRGLECSLQFIEIVAVARDGESVLGLDRRRYVLLLPPRRRPPELGVGEVLVQFLLQQLDFARPR